MFNDDIAHKRHCLAKQTAVRLNDRRFSVKGPMLVTAFRRFLGQPATRAEYKTGQQYGWYNNSSQDPPRILSGPAWCCRTPSSMAVRVCCKRILMSSIYLKKIRDGRQHNKYLQWGSNSQSVNLVSNDIRPAHVFQEIACGSFYDRNPLKAMFV